eukprot:1159388-Pelagomonas_calceolata.AAC.9
MACETNGLQKLLKPGQSELRLPQESTVETLDQHVTNVKPFSSSVQHPTHFTLNTLLPRHSSPLLTGNSPTLQLLRTAKGSVWLANAVQFTPCCNAQCNAKCTHFPGLTPQAPALFAHANVNALFQAAAVVQLLQTVAQNVSAQQALAYSHTLAQHASAPQAQA